MSNQTHHHKSSEPNKTISLTTAKLWVSRWLKFVSEMPGFKGKAGQIPRAIFISMDDIHELHKKYHKEDVIGLRMYFGLAGADEPLPTSVEDMRGLIVPVFKEKKTGALTDLVLSHDELNPNDTSVYDFTAPCPAYCDKASELYLPVS